MGLTLTAWSVIVAAGVLTFAIRGSFLLAVGRLERLPGPVMELLRLIPAAALAALVAPALLRPEGDLVLFGPRPLAGVIALAVAVATRNVLLTIAVGLLAFVGLDLLFG